MAGQSSIFPIFLRAEYRDDGQGFARFQSDAQRAAQAAKREFEGVRAALDGALSRPRNTGGSLDLGVEEMRQAALAQQQIAAAAREVANATKAAASAGGQFDAAMSRSTRAAFELANAEERVSREMLEQVAALEAVQRELNQTASATNLVTQATGRGTTARGNVINSVRAERTAYTQLGQQLTDVGVQYQMGTNLLTILTQQLPQAAFALTGLSDSANKTQAAVGRFATILAGPVGSAIVIATALLSPFIMKLFETGGAAGNAARSVEDLVAEKIKSAAEARNAAVAEDAFARTLDGVTDAARRNREAIERLTGAKRTDAEETLRNSRIQLANALALQFNTQQQIFNAKALLDAQVARATGPGQGSELAALGIAGKQANLDQALANLIAGAGAIADIQKQINDASVLVAVERGVDGAEGQIKRRYEAEIEGLKRTAAARGLSAEEIEREAAAIKSREQASMQSLRADSRSPRRERVDREPQRLASFAAEAAEQVLRINDRFSDQPRLIVQSMQAMRQLDAIIGNANDQMAAANNLTQQQRKAFEGVIASARQAQQTVIEATSRPLELIKQESQQRLTIQEALAAGRIDEAAALQEIFRLEQALGTEAELRAEMQKLMAQGRVEEARQVEGVLANYGKMRDEVRQITLAEQQRLRFLRYQQQVFSAQLDVVQTVRQSLTDILSGRSADFFGNFQQALQDLQGQRLFESIFGQTFRDIENELQGNSPQGRANAAYVQQVERTATATERVGDAAITLAEEFSRALGIMRGGAANDNGVMRGIAGVGGAAQGLLGAAGLGGITVAGNRRSVEIARPSIIDLATRISTGISSSIAAQLEDVLGPRFAAMFGDIVGGAIAGKTLGGTTGGILGGLQGLTANIKGLGGVSDALGFLGQGAALGTQISGISKSLGIGGSSTGAQIGGAIGSFIPIPGGQIIGAIAGNLLGGLIKKTPRASATIGGSGGSLGLTGVTGTSGGLRDAAGNLGDSVLEAVNRIAAQLGASINAGAGSVSIGQRKESLRVDPTGRGITKIGNGAIDFGDDAEAAIAFAVRDLIQDGVITGLRQSEQNLLKAGKDVEAALNDVLRFRAVFDQLDEIRDPVGSAVRKLNTEFESLIDLFEKAGASSQEFADLEELYNFRRAEAIKDATDRVVGSLRSLLDDLKMGDNGLSLRDRQSNTVSRFNGLAARVAAGDASAFDDFADISKQLLDIERQLFGSTQSYFDRLQQVTALTERAVADQTNVTSIGAGAPSPFDDSASIARTIESTNAEQVGWLRAINDNLVTALSPALRPVVGGGGGFNAPLPAFYQNF